MVCRIGRLTWSPATGRARQDRATLTGSVITAAPSADADAYIPAMALTCTDILTQTPQGLCCPIGGFHIDPVRPVERALITHGHSDHARTGHGAVLATRETLDIMGLRYGAGFAGETQAAIPGEAMQIGDVTVAFHPAGHVLGSAQIAVEHGATRIVA